MMYDLIDREALLKAYDAAHKGPPGGARKLIEEAPVVGYGITCIECKHGDNSYEYTPCVFCRLSCMYHSPSFYCGSAEIGGD